MAQRQPIVNGNQNELAFLINEPNEIKEDNHNDPELSNQTTVLNLNNQNVRITFWAIVYMIITTQAIQDATTWYIFDTQDRKINEEATDDAVRLFANNSLWWAAAIILLNLYCVWCTCKCTIFSAFLFIVGGVLQAWSLGRGIHETCHEDGWDIVNKAEKGYCVVSFISSGLFVILFSFYFAVDAVNHIGNNIRTRIGVKSSIIAFQSFLEFWVYLYVDRHSDSDTDTDGNNAENYSLRTLISANFGLFFWCLCALIMVVVNGYGQHNERKKFNTCFKRILGWFIIASTGGSMLYAWFVPFWAAVPIVGWYYVVGAAVIAYDIQYL